MSVSRQDRPNGGRPFDGLVGSAVSRLKWAWSGTDRNSEAQDTPHVLSRRGTERRSPGLGERASNLFGVLLSLTFFSVLLAVMLVAVSILPDSSGLAPPSLPGETGSRPVRTPQPVTLGSLALAPAPALGPAAPVAPVAPVAAGSIPAVGPQVPGGEIVGPSAPEPGGPGNGTAPTGPSRARDDDDEGRRDDEGEDGDGHEDDDGDDDDGDDDDGDDTGSGKHSRDRSRDGRVGRDQGGTDHSEEGRGRGRGKDTGNDSDQGHGKGRGKEGKGGHGGSIGGNDRSKGGGHGSAGGHGHSKGKGKSKGKGH